MRKPLQTGSLSGRHGGRGVTRSSPRILAPAIAATVAFWGGWAGAQTLRVQEMIARALQLEPDEKAGQALYRRNCAQCHGRNADGDARTVTPALAGQVLSYLLKQFADFTEGDREAPEMHRTFARVELNTPQAMRNLATYLHNAPPLKNPQTGDGEHLEDGAKIYAVVCAQCHGANGAGDFSRLVPALRGQHYSYLLTQARRLAAGHRYSAPIEVMEILEALSLDELTGVADFISRLPVSVEPETVVSLGAQAP